MTAFKLTPAGIRRIHNPVPKLLRLLAFWALLVGLAGNGVALAAPCVLMSAGQMTVGMDVEAPRHSEQECMDGAMPADDAPAPQKEKAPGCLAMAACAAVLSVPDTGSADLSCRSGAGEFPTIVTALAGRNLAPEPEPPTRLS